MSENVSWQIDFALLGWHSVPDDIALLVATQINELMLFDRKLVTTSLDGAIKAEQEQKKEINTQSFMFCLLTLATCPSRNAIEIFRQLLDHSDGELYLHILKNMQQCAAKVWEMEVKFAFYSKDDPPR